jgi:hypothetical protein
LLISDFRILPPKLKFATEPAKVALIDGAYAEQWRQQQAGQQCAHNPHDNIQYDPLLCIRVHDDAGEPTENPADDQPQY